MLKLTLIVDNVKSTCIFVQEITTNKNTMTNLYPKREILIETVKTNSLSRISDAVIHFRNYNVNEDKIDYYTITGERNAWYDIKVNFLYDQMMEQIKSEYKDSFNRVMKVTKVN